MLDVKLAYVLGPSDRVVGMAFLVSPRHVLTCAHVVATALNYDRFSVAKPSQAIKLRFFEIDSSLAIAKATVLDWRRSVKPEDQTATPTEREHSDIALLQLDETDLEQLVGPLAVRMCSVEFLDQLRPGQAFIALGSPNGGVLGTAKIGVSRGARWIVVRDGGARIEEGFSGAAAIADEKDGTSYALGMLARAHDTEDQALLIPSATLRSVLAFNGIATSDSSMKPTGGPLLASLRLEIDDLYALKDRAETVDTIQEVLRNSTTTRGPMPVFFLDCDPETDTLDGLVKRLCFEVARDFRLADLLHIVDVDVPKFAGNLDQVSKKHAQDVAGWVNVQSNKDPLSVAAVHYHGVHIRDVDLRAEKGTELTARLVADWAKASSGRTKEVPFFALLTPTVPYEQPDKLKLAAALKMYPDVELHELERLGPVNRTQVRRWARDANYHLPRPVRETALIERNALQLIYQEKQEMTMMAWFEGYDDCKSSLFGKA